MDAPSKVRSPTNYYLWQHRVVVLALYAVAMWLAYKVLSIPAARADFVTSLSSAAILATLGSAVSAVGSLWTADYGNRIALNVDILFRDILKQEAWRRWPFLLRGGQRTALWGLYPKSRAAQSRDRAQRRLP